MESDHASDVAGVRRDDDLLIPVRGESVAATRYHHPETPGPKPTLLMYIPYHKDAFTPYTSTASLIHYLARSGYDVVVADVVGTGASSGVKPKTGSMDEGPQLVAIIEWLADRAWSTGRVGMFGISYGGTTSLKGAAENPEALDAIVSIHGPHTQYRETYQGGSFALYRMGGNWTPYMQALAALPPTRRDPEGRWADVWRERLEGLTEHDPWLFQFLDHEEKDAFWRDLDVAVEDIAVPTFAVCGWRDRYAQATVEYFEAVDAPKRLLLGPWRHEMPHRGRESAIDFRRQVREWFDRFLRDEDSGALARPTVAVWTERDGGGEIDAGAWRELDAWPDVDTEDDPLSLALTPSGLAPAADYDGDALERDYEYDHTVGLDSLDDIYGASEPTDTTPDDVRSLSFETDPLTAPVEWTGTGEAVLRVTATTPDPFLTVRVVDVAPDGAARLVTHGEVRASHRHSLAEADPLDPGEEYAVPVTLKPKSHVFEAGHRIRVAVSAAYFPLHLPEREHGRLTLRSAPASPSTVRFPGRRRDPDVRFEDAVEMPGPVEDPVPLASPYVRGEDATWELTRDPLANSARMHTSDAYAVELPHADVSVSETVETSVAADDPATATARTDVEITVDYGDETVTVDGSSRVSRDVTTLAVTVRFDDEVAFSHRWRR